MYIYIYIYIYVYIYIYYSPRYHDYFYYYYYYYFYHYSHLCCFMQERYQSRVRDIFAELTARGVPPNEAAGKALQQARDEFDGGT